METHSLLQKAQSRVSRMLHSVVRFFDKFPDYSGRLVSVQNEKGMWRVVYPDGLVSQRFGWKTANSYARMFKGKVKHVRYESNAGLEPARKEG